MSDRPPPPADYSTRAVGPLPWAGDVASGHSVWLAPGEHRASVGDITMFYRVVGGGPPMLLLHGGFETADYWQPFLSGPLSERFTIIAVDSRGQGRTTGTDAPITYARMAHDGIGLLDCLGIESAHVVGQSDGGCIALHLLVDYADRIKTATLIGTPFSTANYPPTVLDGLRELVAKARTGAALRRRAAMYRTMAPNPEYWPTLVQKLGDTWLTEPQFTVEQLGTVRRPVLVIDSGADKFLPSSAFKALAAALPNAKLCSFTEGTHDVAREYPLELAAAVTEFIGRG